MEVVLRNVARVELYISHVRRAGLVELTTGFGRAELVETGMVEQVMKN